MVVPAVVCRAFIGRREELAFLDEKRLLAGRSHGGIVLIAGDAGIGKSRLVAEFCSSLASSRWRIGHGACLEHAQRPYDPILAALAALDGKGKSSALSPAATKREQFDAIVDRIERAAAKSGIVVVLEDIHWADKATLELLAFLAPKLEGMRVLLLATLRPHDAPKNTPTYERIANLLRVARGGRIDLFPLDERSLRSLIDETLGELEVPDVTRRAIARTSEGNPFFAEELMKIAVARSTDRRTSASGLPQSLRATVLERWHVLSLDDRRIVSHAAVVGRTFDLSLLERTLEAESEVVLGALARARDIQLLEEVDGTAFRFRHALTREAIYEDFLGAQVKPLHRRIATALEAAPESRRSLEGLAYHWWAAGDDDRAVTYNESAGDAAASVHAHEDAIVFYRRALESPTLAPGKRAAIFEKIADRCFALSFADRANEAYAEAAASFAEARDDDGEARCRVRAAMTAYTIGRPDATAPLHALLERLGPSAYVARSRIHLGIAWLAATYWNPTEATTHLGLVDDRALAIPYLKLRYHNVSAWVAMTVGDLAAFRREHAAWVEAAATDVGYGTVAAAHYNGAWCYATFGLHEEAAREIALALAIARRERSQHAEESSHAIAAVTHVMSGDLNRAREALANVPPTSDNFVTIGHAVAAGTIAGLHLDDGALVATWFDEVGAAMLAAPDSSCGGGLAEILVKRGRRAEAEAVLHLAISHDERPRGEIFTQLAAARYGTPSDAARARRQLAAAASAKTELVERYAVELFDAYALHRERRHDDAIVKARAAAEGFERLRFPLLEARARESAGDIARAIDIYRHCGAIGDVRRLVVPATLDAESAPAMRSTSVGDLSDREREIAALVAAGNSNVEIGRRIEISHKTVEKHLASVYRKLGITSRTQLAALFAATR
jgi:DNA-binding CsgD family transcriptional regulator